MHPRNCETRQGNKDRVFRFWITLLDQRHASQLEENSLQTTATHRLHRYG
jgi:hypothetical protein